MRKYLAAAAALALFGVAAPAAAERSGLQIDAAAALNSPVVYVNAWVDPELIRTRISSYRYDPDDSFVGPRDAEILGAELAESLERAFAAHGLDAAPGARGATVEAVIVDARPDNPALTELGFRSDMNAVSSRGRGGAAIEAVVRDADGAVIGEYSYRYFERFLDDISANGAWSEAELVFDRFADRLAQELARQSRGGS